MNYFAVNIGLALAWAALTGGFSTGRLAMGFVLGYVMLGFVERMQGQVSYTRKGFAFIAFVLYFLKELAKANVEVAWDVITFWEDKSHPRLMAIPVEAESDLELTLLANLVSLTPGTLSLDVSPDRRHLYVHAMFAEDRQAVIDDVRDLERRLLKVTR